MKIEYIEADQDWQNETTTYWFEITGEDIIHNCYFEKATFGIAEFGNESWIVDPEGEKISDGSDLERCLKKYFSVACWMRGK